MSTPPPLSEREFALRLYSNLRSLPPSHWKKVSGHDITAHFKKEMSAQGKSISEEHWKTAGGDFRYLGRIASQCSQEDFLAYCLENELPAIQLTTTELEALKGGNIFRRVWGVMQIVFGSAATAVGLVELYCSFGHSTRVLDFGVETVKEGARDLTASNSDEQP